MLEYASKAAPSGFAGTATFPSAARFNAPLLAERARLGRQIAPLNDSSRLMVSYDAKKFMAFVPNLATFTIHSFRFATIKNRV